MRLTYSLVGGEGGVDGFGVVSGVGLGGAGGEAGGFVLIAENVNSFTLVSIFLDVLFPFEAEARHSHSSNTSSRIFL